MIESSELQCITKEMLVTTWW